MKWIVVIAGIEREQKFSSYWLRTYQKLNKDAGKIGIPPIITWRFEY